MRDERERSEEAKEIMAQIVIKEKSTGKIVDRDTCYYSAAESKAKSMLGRHGNKYKYEIIEVLS